MAKDTSCPAYPTPDSVTGSSHRSMAIVSGISMVLTTIITLVLVVMHLHRYSAPKEQRQIVKIILTPVVITLVSFFSFFSYDVAQFINPIIDLYEAFALASLFLLFVQYSVPSGTFGQDFFEGMAKAAAAVGGHQWARAKWVGAFQFSIVEPILYAITAAALATNTFCEGSLKPRYANLWVTLVRSISMIIALFAVLRLYSGTKELMKPRRAVSKLLSFKVIIGLNILQTWIIKALVQHDVVQPSSSLSYADLLYGVPAALVSVESVFFALGYHYAFSSSEYASKPRRMNFFLAILDSMNPTDLLKGMARAIRLLSSSRNKHEDGSDGQSVQPFNASSRDRSISPMPGAYGLQQGHWKTVHDQASPRSNMNSMA